MFNKSSFRFLTFLYLLLLIAVFAFGQTATHTIEKLTAAELNGRGYYKNGDLKAALFIRDEFKHIGLQPLSGNYFQQFQFPVNTFPGKMLVEVGNLTLVPGKDFIVSPACPSVKGTFNLIKVTLPPQQFSLSENGNDFILIDKSGLDSTGMAIMDSISRFPPPVRGVVVVEEKKLTWSVSQSVSDQVFIRIMKEAIPADAQKIKLNIQNKFVESHKANNVIGFVPGTQYPDSFIVFSAHYDHLGRMGKQAMFPGANDNASGTAMILDLARYYSQPANRPKLSILFIAFAGEEAGLVGSKYYTENPLFSLSKIRFLINLDLMGNGEEGVMVVNGAVYEEEFQKMNAINNMHQLVKEIGKRGKARNSDHYWFSERGVPSFFLYTMGGSKAYHDIYDVSSAIKLTEFEDIKVLLEEFVKTLTNQ